MAKFIGLTGGIGTGKSTVAKIFEHLAIPCFYTDIVAKNIIRSNTVIQQQITDIFGNEAFVNNQYQAKYIAGRVFESPKLLEKLNEIIHPAVRLEGLIWAQKHSDKPYCLYEAALITKESAINYFDHVILVTAPLPIRISRVQKRDNRTIAQINDIMAKQPIQEEQLLWADFEIKNDEQKGLIDQVLAIDKAIRAKI